MGTRGVEAYHDKRALPLGGKQSFPVFYAVSRSSSERKNMACSRESPHISCDGCKLAHTAGLPGCPKIRQLSASSSCTQRIPAGLPFGIPGIGEVIDGAVQQAPQPGRQVGWSLIVQHRGAGKSAMIAATRIPRDA